MTALGPLEPEPAVPQFTAQDEPVVADDVRGAAVGDRHRRVAQGVIARDLDEVGVFGQREMPRLVGDPGIDLVKRPWIDESVDTFAGGLFAFAVLGFDSRAAATLGDRPASLLEFGVQLFIGRAHRLSWFSLPTSHPACDDTGR